MGAPVADPVYTPVTLDKDRYISLEDNVELPLLFMSWPTVHVNHADEAPLDVLMSIMGTGQTSLLYKNLEKPGLTVQASAGHGCRELNCSFTLFALANPARVQKLSDMETIIRESLDEFEARGVEDDDITRVKAGIVSGMIYGLESVNGKVGQLAFYETFRNNPNGIGDDIARYEAVSKADVMRVYNQYIKNKSAVIMSIVPKGQSGMIIKAPDVYRTELTNRIKVLGAVNAETPTTTINLSLKAGQVNESLDKLGLAALTAAMLNEATTKSSAEDLSNRLDKIGSSVSVSSADNSTTLSIRTLTKNLDETIEIAAEKLFHPKFDPEDFMRVKANTIQGIRQAKKQPELLPPNCNYRGCG